MATINLGSIKFKWKGTYNGATAYTVDDVVEYNGSSYICILASTGNLPTNATYFEQMSSAGTNGTDGTDLTTTLTTQGDIVYRDASGLARLGAGTAGQVLQSGGTGANPSWGSVSSDYVKLTSVNNTNITASSYNFEQFVDETLYNSYVIKGYYMMGSSGSRLYSRFLNGSTEITSNYRWSGYRSYVSQAGTGSTIENVHDQGTGLINWVTWAALANFPVHFQMDLTINNATNVVPAFSINVYSKDDTGTPWIYNNRIGGFYDDSTNVDGINFYSASGGAIGTLNLTIWGLKK